MTTETILGLDHVTVYVTHRDSDIGTYAYTYVPEIGLKFSHVFNKNGDFMSVSPEQQKEKLSVAQEILPRKLSEVEELHHFEWERGKFALALSFEDVILEHLEGEQPPINAVVAALLTFKWAKDVIRGAIERRKNPYLVSSHADQTGKVEFRLSSAVNVLTANLPVKATIVADWEGCVDDFRVWSPDLVAILHYMRRNGWLEPFTGELEVVPHTRIQSDWLVEPGVETLENLF